jgi:hypothetical protein
MILKILQPSTRPAGRRRYANPVEPLSVDQPSQSHLVSRRVQAQTACHDRASRRGTSMQAVTKYARSGDVHIAYQAFGEGPINLVLVPGFVSNVENYWEQPDLARFPV